jgi:prepilin-type N-terminal cleavage/methylation domain-containing protein
MNWKKTRKSNAGFTMIEIMVTLAILSIIVASGVAALQNYMKDSQNKSLNEKAKTIFFASQEAFQNVKNDSMNQYLLENHLVLDAVSESWSSAPVDWNNENVRKNLFYLTIDKNDHDKKSKELYRLLSRFVNDQDILDQTILIEFNAKSGLVSSVFYSEMADKFNYLITADNNASDSVSVYSRDLSLLKERKVGFYGNARTGIGTQILSSFNVSVKNDIKLAVHWTTPHLDTNNLNQQISYKVILYNKTRDKILANYDITNQTPGYTSGQENILVLDNLKASEPSDKPSDFILRMPVTSFIAVVEASIKVSGNDSYKPISRAASKVSHTLFKSEKKIDGKSYYTIDNIRHLNNIRYGESDFNYIQLEDLSANILGYPGYIFKPLKGFPTRTGLGLIDQTNLGVSAFNGSFNGNQKSIELKIADTNYNSQYEGVGLFSVLGSSGILKNISVVNSQITGNNNVASLVGINEGEIQYCNGVVNSINGTVTLGGLVAINKNKISESYTSNVRVFGEEMIGGLVGNNNSGNTAKDAIIENCYVSGVDPDDLPNKYKSLLYASEKKTVLLGAICAQNLGIVRYTYSNIYVVHKVKKDDPDLLIGNPVGNLPIKSFLLSEKNYNEDFTGQLLSFDEMTNTNAMQLFKNFGFQDSIWESKGSKSVPNGYTYISFKNLKHIGEWPDFDKKGKPL